MIASAPSPVTGYDNNNILCPGTFQSRLTKVGLFHDDISPTVEEAIFFGI
jgi:hypothetical protein